MERNHSLGVYASTKHDGKTDDDENNDEEKVSEITEDAPDLNYGAQASVADALGLGLRDEIVFDIGDILASLGRGMLVHDADYFNGAGDKAAGESSSVRVRFVIVGII